MTNAVSISQGGSNNVTMRNRIINGAMVISQYNGTSSVTPANNAYAFDRWAFYQSTVANKFSAQQLSSSPPVGFTNYIGITSLSAFSPGTNDYYSMYQKIEGYNFYDLGWGTANAKTITLSFWVQSSLTGTFGGSLVNSAGARTYGFSYSIPVANTWTYISVTIPGDTTGTWETGNGNAVRVLFSLGVGSGLSGTAGSWASGNYLGITGQVNVVATNGATWNITGVQLEVGTTASPFEYRQYGTELVLCQRYFEQVSFSNGLEFLPLQCENTTTAYGSFRYIVTKRATPTAALVNTSSIFITNASGSGVSTTVGFSYSGVDFVRFNCTSSGLVAGNISMFYMSSPGSIQISAEL